MRYILTISTVFLWALVGSIHGAETGVHLFILSGQSNMEKMRPEHGFTPTVEKKFGKDNVLVVKDAKGGAPISFFYKEASGAKDKTGGWLYDRLMVKVNEAIKGKTIKTVTFVWMQGESDAKPNGAGKDYATQLRGLLNLIRQDLKIKDLNVVIGRISDHKDEKRFPQWELIRQLLVEVAESEPSGAWVNTDDLNDGGKLKNDLHYNTPGAYGTLGTRFAEKAIELIEKKSE